MILDVNFIAVVKSLTFYLIIVIVLSLGYLFFMPMAISGPVKSYIIPESARDLGYQMERDVSSSGAPLNHLFHL